ncbi:MAG TPA: DUF4389 domain-containing protein [Dehalococcoidia bacterium]|nr:DUF4389 domain-containing protein [Dehalococcoidia bacterium]
MQDSAAYPVSFDIRQPESLNRILNFPLFIGTTIKALLLIPHFIIIYLFSIALVVLWILGPFGILFTGNYPQGLFNFNVGINRWISRVYAYYYSTVDQYPPFSLDEGREDLTTLRVDYPTSLSRLLNFPIIGTMVKAILVIPQLVILVFAAIGVLVLVFVGQFVILFTGAMPAGFHAFIAAFLRLSYQVTAWVFSLTDQYPPFIPTVESSAQPPTPEPPMAAEPPGPPPVTEEPPGPEPPPPSAG